MISEIRRAKNRGNRGTHNPQCAYYTHHPYTIRTLTLTPTLTPTPAHTYTYTYAKFTRLIYVLSPKLVG